MVNYNDPSELRSLQVVLLAKDAGEFLTPNFSGERRIAFRGHFQGQFVAGRGQSTQDLGRRETTNNQLS